jgi:hypothetical protein
MNQRDLESVRRKLAVILRRAGLSCAQIAALPGPSGAPLYSSATSCHRALRRARGVELAPADELVAYAAVLVAMSRAGVPPATRQRVESALAS